MLYYFGFSLQICSVYKAGIHCGGKTTQYSAADKTKLQVNPEFLLLLQRQRVFHPKDQTQGQLCRNTDLMWLPLPAWLNFSALVVRKSRSRILWIRAEDLQSHVPSAGQRQTWRAGDSRFAKVITTSACVVFDSPRFFSKWLSRLSLSSYFCFIFMPRALNYCLAAFYFQLLF